MDIDEKTGKPTGILRENAVELLSKLLGQEDTYEEKMKFALKSLETFAAHGVTGIQTNDTASIGNVSNAWEIYSEIMSGRITRKEISPLPCRVFLTSE